MFFWGGGGGEGGGEREARGERGGLSEEREARR